MGKPIKLLIIEDSAQDAALLIQKLQKGGYDAAYEIVETHQSMSDALDHQEWDLVISDYSMPCFSGLEALELLQEKDPDLSFILMTDQVGEEVAVEAMRAGAHDYILKSNTVRLISAIDRELRETKARREKRRTELALQESQERYRLIVETTNEGIYSLDKDMRISFINRQAADLFGYTVDEMTGQHVFLFVDPDWHEIAAETFHQRSQGLGGQVEYKLIRKDGTPFWVIVNGNPYFDLDGSYLGMIGMLTDITKRKEMEQAVREQLHFLQVLIDAIPAPIFYKNPAAIYLGCNEAFATYLGIPKDSIIGKSPYDISPKELADKYFQQDNALFNDPGIQIYEAKVNYADGSDHDVMFHKATFQDTMGCLAGLVGVMLDITDRKRAEEHLKDRTEELNKAEQAAQEVKKQLTHIIDFLPDATLVIDKEGKVIIWSRAMEEMTGIRSEDMIGKGDYEYAVVLYGERRPILIDLVLQPDENIENLYLAVKREGDLLTAESNITLPGGRKQHVSARATPIYNENGEFTGAIECFRDITDLVQYRQHLEERTEELEQAKAAAEAATQTKSEFLANMSHEIRTPMNAIIGFANLALKTGLSAKQYDYVKKIETAAKSLLGIINEVLDFSKIEAGRLQMEAIDFRLNDVMNNIANIIAIDAAEKGVELLNVIADDVPQALIGDPLRLGQVLANLANNAVKFTETGHILIKAELLEKSDQYCTIQFMVSDTGIGITEEQLEKLFIAFSQADASMTRKYGGTGLGLTISKRLVEMMNGKISVTSSPGKGSSFTFDATFARQPEEREYRLTAPTEIAGLKVLVVDDSAPSREILTAQIESFGFETGAVESGEQAIIELKSAALDKPYGLVLMDWKMPGMDGIETAKAILQDRGLKYTPIIIMVSAFSREDVIKKAERTGINAFLMKPVNQSLLFDSIMETFGRDGHIIAGLTKPAGQVKIAGGMEGIKVLLVEDYIMNQQVALEMLHALGVAVDVVSNGREALEAIATFDYDLVLMDVQMPVMGGCEATRLIRADGRYAELPIIAMTAHAVQGAKEYCLNAGMNDYISKPIDHDQLFSVLSRWIKLPEGAQETKAQPHGPASESAWCQNLPGINIASGLKRLDGNRDFYWTQLAYFSAHYAAFPQDVMNKLSNGDIATASRLAHTLVGVAGNLSMDGLYDIARRLEDAIGKSPAAVGPLLDELAAELQLVQSSIRQLSPTGEKELPGQEWLQELAIDAARTAPVLAKLTILLDEDNLEAIHCLEDLKECLGSTILAQDMKELEDYIVRYEFETAKQVLYRIVQVIDRQSQQ